MSHWPKYSLLECERRFLVATMPEGLGPGTLIAIWRRHIIGTEHVTGEQRLRLVLEV